MKYKIISVTLGIILTICIIHNLMFQAGFFGGSTYGYYNNETVRIFKIRNQKALISKILVVNGGIVYSKNENNHWVDVSEIDFF